MIALEHPLFADHSIKVWMKRDDLNHPTIQGNKWHKLKLNLEAAKAAGKSTLLTFGGAYSNHIAATAAAGQAFGFQTIGYIRGDELADRPERWSHTLLTAQQNGMQLHFLPRADYRLKTQSDFLNTLSTKHSAAYILPEGGTNQAAVQGFQTLSQTIESQCPNWSHLFTAVGTGGTLAGLVKFATPKSQRRVLGIASLKQADYLIPDIEAFSGVSHNAADSPNWRLLTEYCGPGYGQTAPDIEAARHWFESQFHIPLDSVYTNKMVYGFLQELQSGRLPSGSKVVLYHSGGLQGNPKT
jgi:1-aminocyclopropane-1-carboxylate deaminase